MKFGLLIIVGMMFLLMFGCVKTAERQTEAQILSAALKVPVTDSSNVPTVQGGVYTFSWDALPPAESYGIMVYNNKSDAMTNKNVIGMGIAVNKTSITTNEMSFTTPLIGGETYAYTVVGATGDFDGSQQIVSASVPFEFEA